MDISPHVGSPESPPIRSTVLGFGASFLRGRPRAASQVDNSQSAASNNNFIPDTISELSPSQARPQSGGFRTGGVQGNNSNTGVVAPTSASHNQAGTVSDAAPPATSTSLSLSMLRRRRSGGAANAVMSSALVNRPAVSALSPTSPGASHRIRLVPHLDSRRTLHFDAICRNLKEGDPPLRIGRFTDRSGMGLAAANALSSNKLAFKSKVVSRAHAEIWVDIGGKFYIKDTKSSSGTFLNHVRLSPANSESRPHQIKDGDILQLGVDYQGGTEDMYKSVKIRIEVGREWQTGANAFKYVSLTCLIIFLLSHAINFHSCSTNALNQLKSLAVSTAIDPAKCSQLPSKKPSHKTSIPDCCICRHPCFIHSLSV
jgi:pSer/pThr/pTyr-binding forkhead associated (FHA) protein